MRRRRSGRRKGPSAKDIPKILVLLAAAILVGWAVVTTSAVNALRRNPPAAAVVAPYHPQVRATSAMSEFRRNQGRVRPDTLAALTASLDQAPLTEEPFLLNGVAALARGDQRVADRLLAESLRRNPRSKLTRMLLLDGHLRNNRMAAAASQIAMLSRLMPSANQVLIPELARFATDSSTRPALAGALRSDPLLRPEILKHLAITGADADIVLDLARRSGAPLTQSGAADWQAILLQKLVEKGEIARAYDIWKSLLGTSAEGPKLAVHDPRFRGQPGHPPFNWQLGASGGGVAERTRGSQLQVEYYGRAAAELASQVLMLRPGRYRLQFTAGGDADGKGSRLSWRVDCIPSKATAGEIPVRVTGYSPQTMAGSFTVPAMGCSAQWLRLVGTPAEFPAGQSLTLTEVGVREAS